MAWDAGKTESQFLRLLDILINTVGGKYVNIKHSFRLESPVSGP